MPKKQPKTANFSKNSLKTREKIPFGRQSESKQEKPKKNYKKTLRKHRKKLKTQKTRLKMANFAKNL